jgi:hypothetical protein
VFVGMVQGGKIEITTLTDVLPAGKRPWASGFACKAGSLRMTAFQ